jgi:hypothetical protein
MFQMTASNHRIGFNNCLPQLKFPSSAATNLVAGRYRHQCKKILAATIIFTLSSPPKPIPKIIFPLKSLILQQEA